MSIVQESQFLAAPSSGPDEPVARFELCASDAAAVCSLADGILEELDGAPADTRLEHVALLAHELPRSLRRALIEFRLGGAPSGGFVLSGLPVDDSVLGPTPKKSVWTGRTHEQFRADMRLLLVASLLGDPFAHAAVQEGRLILDVAPAPGDEDIPIGSSSSGGLAWHCEDAVHEGRADWMLLMCLRNPIDVPTTFARMRDVTLPPEVIDILFQPRFLMASDPSHMTSAGLSGVNRKVAVLSGDRAAPFLRIDPVFMERALDDPDAEKALSMIIDEIDGNLQDVPLAPGEIFFVDNRRAVHGRRPFQARYDGTDRWLRVLNVTADLRKSAGMWTGSHGRAMVSDDVTGMMH